MTDELVNSPNAELGRILESAQRLGIELDESEALQWLTSMAASQSQLEDISQDTNAGIFGHKVAMLDFSPQDLAHFRAIGHLVEFQDQPGVVETALALSGSSAQSKIQTYPGDATTSSGSTSWRLPARRACRILAGLDARKGLEHRQGADLPVD